ncbi:2-amino-4-hydroxy-6-hydroxymethyldihydropteridine diphosphokinase [Enterococcus rivorum]|uniref:2-amino-4-hydroxy-6-hydroxymethyldihydropteridine diphosphokinase n=1 Tax=Enterococcus rivorum TaxID=762845 RepID=A0A1E5KYT8_9ENTE|nr:2-amino-4-hydroxy-6-hydroxymethyldihydropteridine diphosphokinase [Enterococcus rivorum]MBP2097603.1 2-amino-4-hydroxy-6-hydroxymethyldihydropteridine diphosphokinase [Enterococcus rivorum]OEH83051.1 2-amino-4-hydroxy-6-hydroxymethyldihydropteridine diphosphokinase [Enterococcus rivorum]
MTVGYLALGSNLGDRLENLKAAVAFLNQESRMVVTKKSLIYETKPYGDVPQDNYLNAVIQIDTDYAPQELLVVTQTVEKKLKRERLIRWGPRTIDIDILLLGQQIVTEPDLVIPHQEIAKRSFVLIPLKDVYVGKTLFSQSLEKLIDQTGNKNEVWISGESW